MWASEEWFSDGIVTNQNDQAIICVFCNVHALSIELRQRFEQRVHSQLSLLSLGNRADTTWTSMAGLNYLNVERLNAVYHLCPFYLFRSTILWLVGWRRCMAFFIVLPKCCLLFQSFTRTNLHIISWAWLCFAFNCKISSLSVGVDRFADAHCVSLYDGTM